MQPEPRTPDLLAEIARLKAVIEELKTSKPYGLVWEDKPEQFERDAENAVPVLAAKGGKYKDVELDPGSDHHVLIEGDNYHALSVLSYTHKGKIDVLYIDPPYNTGNKSWKYNNDYVEKDDLFRHSKWLSFMAKRLKIAIDLLSPTGSLVCAIDDYEVHQLGLLLEHMMPNHERDLIVIQHHPQGAGSNTISRVHEYAFVCTPRGCGLLGRRQDDEEGVWSLQRSGQGENNWRKNRPNQFFAIHVDATARRVIGVGPEIGRGEQRYPMSNTKEGLLRIYPIDRDGGERVWRYNRTTMQRLIEAGAIEYSKAGALKVHKEKAASLPVFSVWTDSRYNAGTHGTNLIANIFNKKAVFDYPKSIWSVYDILSLLHDDPASVFLDFFAGSGTTGHAVLELNKDGGNRRVILCTNNENGICEDVTYERMKRVMKGYTAPDGEKVPGLGGNLKYLKTAFVKKELPVGLSDEAKLELTRKANLIIGLRENAFTSLEANDHYEILSSPTKLVGIYFRENKEALTKMLDRMTALAGDKQGFAYVFSWEKGAYKTGFDGYPFTFEDIPEPLVEVYQSIGL